MGEKDSLGYDGEAAAVLENKVQEPHRYRIFLHNDDYTTMDFVINILRFIFHKNSQDAAEITMKIHTRGIGECGVYTREIAETKVCQVRQEARQAGFPLRCTMEKV